MKNSDTIPNRTGAVIDFTKVAGEKSHLFSVAVHSELMLELMDGDINPQAIYALLTSQGKMRVQTRMSGQV